MEKPGERISPFLSSLDAQGLLAHKVGPVSDGILFLVQFVREQVMLGSLLSDLCNYEFVSRKERSGTGISYLWTSGLLLNP